MTSTTENAESRAGSEVALNDMQLREMFGVTPLEAADPTKDMTDEQRKVYVAQIAVLVPVIENEVKALVAAQVDHIARRVANASELTFHRGCINFADVLLERLRELSAEHQQNVLKQQPQDQESSHQVFPKV